ncbi:MAG: glycosyltransferase family 2 protein [Candidatus Scalindua sp.]
MGIYISLVVNTLNEEQNIADCILSARELVNEVVVVDMHSDDRTVEIARSLGAEVHLIERVPFVDPTRNYAIAQATGEWILLLDADERLTPKLANELRSIAEKDHVDMVRIHRDTYMFGQRIRYSGWQRDIHYRFFKKGFLKYPNEEVHAWPKAHGRILILDPCKGKIQHFNYKDLHHFIKKMNDYTDGEALKLLKTNGKISPLRGIYWGLHHFCKRFFKLRGFKDGNYGLILSVMMGFYWFLAFAKAWDKKQRSRKQA